MQARLSAHESDAVGTRVADPSPRLLCHTGNNKVTDSVKHLCQQHQARNSHVGAVHQSKCCHDTEAGRQWCTVQVHNYS